MTSEWTLVTLKEHLEQIINERDAALRSSFASSQIAIEKAEERLNAILQELPQKYGRKEEFESLRKEINAINQDHVQRREFDGLKDDQNQSRGARVALIATSGVVLTLIAVALGSMYANQLSHRDVSEQIQIESPWLSDKPTIEARLDKLETEVIRLRTSLATHEVTDKLRAAKK